MYKRQVHVIHTTPFVAQPDDIGQTIVTRPTPIPTVHGDEQIVEKILDHRPRGRGFQFLTLMKGAPSHDASWQPSSDFVDPDGTVNEIFHNYICENNSLQKYQ